DCLSSLIVRERDGLLQAIAVLGHLSALFPIGNEQLIFRSAASRLLITSTLVTTLRAQICGHSLSRNLALTEHLDTSFVARAVQQGIQRAIFRPPRHSRLGDISTVANLACRRTR